MTERNDYAGEAVVRAHDTTAQMLAELVGAASVDRVFGESVEAGDATVITAAEIQTGTGFGYGVSSGPRMAFWGRGEGRGGGGGGGGHVVGRPVAVVTIDPEGVHVQPVIDRTKIAVTALTALGALGLTMLRLRRFGRR